MNYIGIRERVAEVNPVAMLFDGYDNCIIGIDIESRAVYSLKRIIKTIMIEDEVSELEAVEYYEYNMERSLAYMDRDGFAPVILDDFFNDIFENGEV